MFDKITDAAIDGVTDFDLDLGVDFRWARHLTQEQRTALGRTQLETLDPGDRLGRLLTTFDPSGLDMHDLVSYMGACERQTAWAQARQLVAIRELAGRRLVVGPHGEPADTALPAGAVNEFAADEVAAVLSLSRSTGQRRVWLATALCRLAATEALFAAGQLTLTKVLAIAEGLSVLDDDAAAAAEARLLVRAPQQTLGLLRAAVRRAVLAADPTAAKERAEETHAERRVELTPHGDGMCEVWALLPAADAMALWTALTALADKARAAERAAAHNLSHPPTPSTGHYPPDHYPPDHSRVGQPPTGSAAAFAAYGVRPDGWLANTPSATGAASASVASGAGGTERSEGADRNPPAFEFRTMDQLRADVVADLAYATLERADLPRHHRRRPHIQVTVAASTLLGLDDQPGELAGYGPITAQVARLIAAEGTWRRLLTDPATGGLLDYGTTVHDPPKNLTDHVITRDQTCRGLGCRIRAERCDLDHTIRFPDGPTADHNLTCECRRCHIRKHQAGWKLQLLPNGDVVWTSPTGHSYHDPVPAVLDTGTEPRAPADDTPPF
jgi:hypothetical protein